MEPLQLALPPSDPKLYEECKNGVLVTGTMTIPRLSKSKRSKNGDKSKSGKKGKNGADSDSDYDDTEEQKEMKDKFHDEWEKKRKGRSTKEIETNTLLVDNHYDVLGLEDLGMAATDSHIKTAYRKLALIYHPDKGKQIVKDGDAEGDQELNPEEVVKKEIWLKIQKAYEILMDADKRRKFDSSLPFDDDIPDEDDLTKENFFDLFVGKQTLHNHSNFNFYAN